MKNNIIKNCINKDITLWVTILLISIAVIMAGINLHNKLICIVFGIIVCIYSILFSLAIVKKIVVQSQLESGDFQDYIEDEKKVRELYINKKENRDKKIYKVFVWFLIITVFISGISILIGVYMDKMMLALVLPGWLLSIDILFFFTMIILKNYDKRDDYEYMLSKRLVRISDNAIYYKGIIYYKDIYGFSFHDNAIFFLKYKIANIKLDDLKEINKNLVYGISACLAGFNVKYNGGNNLNEEIKKLFDDKKAIVFCPESAGGLKNPRVPSEIIGDGVFSQELKDVTFEFKLGAEKSLHLFIENNIKKAIMKAKSPSCGKGQVYDGTFSHTLISGNGVTVDLLLENGIEIITENEYMKMIEEENNGKES